MRALLSWPPRCLGSSPLKQAAKRAGPRSRRRAQAGSSDEGEGGAAPCEMCGRTFPHEHIRAIYRGDGDGDSSGSDGER